MKQIMALTLCLLLVSTAAFAGGAQEATESTTTQTTTVSTGTHNEAPILAERVASGDLPAVDERLPESPLVIEPFEQVGTYGGIVRNAHRGPSDSTGYYRMVREPLVNYDPMLRQVNPNLAESWTVSPDGKVITFNLRRGLKWSDGEPFTTEDVLFWWEVMNTAELYPAVPSAYVKGGEPVSITAPDDYTIVFTWPVPQAAFINWIAAGRDENYMPKHYLSQFHINYVDEAKLVEMAEAEGLNTWRELFELKAGTPNNFRAVGRPTMDAWFVTTGHDAPILVSERNPYYFKVDTAGNQLPYVDYLHRILTEDVEVMKLQLMAGELDYITRNLWTTYSDLPLYTANADRGDYRIIRTAGGTPGAFNIMFNVTYDEDEAVAELMRNIEFKQALSLAIDRDEINDVRFNGLGRNGHGHFHFEHDGYVEEVDQAFVDYDPARANAMLDSVGMSARDADGYRLRPDGEEFTLIIDGSTHHPHHAEGGELIKSYFEAVGVRTVVSVIDRGLWESKREGNGHMATFADLADPLIPLEQTGHIVSYVFAPLWDLWFNTNGEQGEEPSADAKRIMEIYNVLAPATGDDAQRAAYVSEIAEIWGRNFWTIGTVGVPFNLSFAKNDLRNVPLEGAHSHPANPAVYRPYQWYWQQ